MTIGRRSARPASRARTPQYAGVRSQKTRERPPTHGKVQPPKTRRTTLQLFEIIITSYRFVHVGMIENV